MADAAIEVRDGGDSAAEKVPETDDERALRAVLASAQSTDANGAYNGPIIDIIAAPVTEEDAYKQDVAALPESASLEDYERVPVSQFGAALLRGMGWKEGEVASRSKRFHGKGQDGKQKGLIEPWIPTARPALLGIGAKEKEVYDDGSAKGKGGKGKGRPEKRYIPVVKVEKNGSGASGGERDGDSRSGSISRRRSPERSRRESSRRSPSPAGDRRRDKDYDRDRERRYKDKERSSYRDEGSRERERERRRDYDDSSRRDLDDRRRDRERSPDRDRYGDSSSRRRDKDGRDV